MTRSPAAILASLDGVLCPLCRSAKPPGRAFCDSCLAALPWSVRRGLCGGEDSYVAAMGALLAGRGLGESDGKQETEAT